MGEVQVADEIIAEFSGTHSDTATSLEVQFNSMILNIYSCTFVLLLKLLDYVVK
jgi:hypothetical protein